jgi:hypothetical protein
MTHIDSTKPECALLLALAEYVETDHPPIQRAIFASYLKELVNVYNGKPAVASDAPVAPATRSQDIRVDFEKLHLDLLQTYGEDPIHIAELRRWYVTRFGEFQGADLDLQGNKPCWHKTIYNAVDTSEVFTKCSGMTGHFRVLPVEYIKS